MIYFSLFILALLMYELIWTITNEIKEYITKESDRIIETLKNENYETRNNKRNN